MDPKIDEAEIRSIKRPMVIGAILVFVLVALAALVIAGTRLAEAFFGGPTPEAIATSSLESMRAQNRLNVFAARYVSVSTARQSRFGFSTERTLILPGDVRYEVDMARLDAKDVRWDEASKTLSVTLPEIEIAGPEVDLAAAREYGSDGVVATIVGNEQRLDRANRAAAVADLRKQALAETPMRLAREAARSAVERSFALPLKAAGFEDARVVARFASEVETEPSYIDHSRSYNEVLEEARSKQR